MAMTLRLPEDVDRRLTERAEREHRSKQELAIEAIKEANARAELDIHGALDELMGTQAETLDRLK
ncbi:hypothetical protein [Streptomyces luteolus]|uniref:Arc-like DNA binding domain-containing protein n=1 Tax=Streptomyces luteolus TaxID=3043615 RepID=A0ABT6SR43_9ACTN|nr:hypothetical protein [Streptomyces sp. B-S-A12]MDI3418069.1 hypothetical protein [Streptomyces sp. B-S-A12]